MVEGGGGVVVEGGRERVGHQYNSVTNGGS